ncbi:MAG: hypothetical protein ACSHX7_02755 [Luteolibacter sp.]
MSKDPKSPDPENQKNIQHTRSRDDAAELDLWDLEDSDSTDAPPDEKPAIEKPQLPTRRENSSVVQSQKPKAKPIEVSTPTEKTEEKPSSEEIPKPKTTPKKRQLKKTGKTASAPLNSREEFNTDIDSDIDDNVDSTEAEEPKSKTSKAEKPETPAKKSETAPSSKAPVKTETTVKKEPETEPADKKHTETEAQEKEAVTLAEEPQAKPDPGPTDSKLLFSKVLASLTKAEKIGIASLFAVLVLSSVLLIVYITDRAATAQAAKDAELELPVVGNSLTVTSVDTFWRAPVTSGSNPDIVRRGTKLIPVVNMTLESNGKPIAIRVLFRDSLGIYIGDPINRRVKTEKTLSLAATAGFDDVGMHAAYRTEESPPWTVEVLEGSDINASSDKFTVLFETTISTNVR